MYSIQSAYGIAVNPSAIWGSAENVGDLTGVELGLTYRELFLTLKINGVNTTITIDVFKQAPTIADDERTLAIIFGAWDPANVLVNEPKPTYVAKKAVYFDLRYSGFKIDAVVPGGNIGSSNDLNTLEDLVIARSLTSMANFHKRILVNVNGFFYNSLLSGNTVIVPGASKSLRDNHQTLVGGLSFESIGDITCVQITEDHVLPATPDRPLNEGVLFKLPAAAVGKSVMVVIGGYLHLASWNGYFHYINDRTLALDIYKLRLEERYAESQPFLDVEFQRPDGLESNHTVDGAYLRSDEVLMKLLTMRESFFVIVDTPSLKSVTSGLHSLKMPGRFLAYKEPTDPIICGAGKLMNYWKISEAGIWGIHGPVVTARPAVDVMPRSASVANTHFHWTEPYQGEQACAMEIIADKMVL